MPQSASWSGTPSVMGSTESMRMALLTFSLIGLQFTWGIEMTYCTPYLLQLGLTKSKTSLVWLAGPLSGLIMQPVVGAIADRSTSKWGRRRPFMVAGSIIVSICLVLLGWTTEFVGFFIQDETSKKSATILIAVLSIYAVDFAINAVMASCRGLIVDTLPISQQQAGSAWASRMAACGHVIGYLIGTLDLVAIFGPIFGDTQFKKMILVAAGALLICVGITSYAVTERVLLATPGSAKSKSVFSILPSLLQRTLHLPPRIRAICWAQFWSWIGWFPFLFYSTTWVGETYYRYEHPTAPSKTEGEHDALGNIGRLGSFSLVIFSFITFASSVLLPYVVRPPLSTSASPRGNFTPRPPPSLSKSVQAFFMRMSALQPDLVTAWLLSHLSFTAIMIWAPFVRSLSFATTLVALAGVPWAVVGWAPFAELGVEINKMGSGVGESALGTSGGYAAVRPPVSRASNDCFDDDVEIEMEEGALRRDQYRDQHRGHRSTGSANLHSHHDPDSSSSTGDLAGVYLGVLNVYTTLPQFVGTFISWVVFSLLEPSPTGKGDGKDDDSSPDHHKWLDLKKDAPNAIAVCLFIGACCAVVAAEATRRLKRMS